MLDLKKISGFTVRILLYFAIVIVFFLFNFCYRPIEGNPLLTDEYKESPSYVNNLYVSDDYFKNSIEFSDLEEQYYDLYIHGKVISHACPIYSCDDIDFDKLYYVRSFDHPEIFKGNYKGNMFYILRLKWFERELDNIRKDTKKMTDQEKIIFVYKYIAEHQMDFVYIPEFNWYNFAARYSELFGEAPALAQIIFQNVGIKSYIAHYSNGEYGKTVNLVEYDGKYYYYDSDYFPSLYKIDSNNSAYYDGFIFSPEDGYELLYEELYPKIEKQSLKEVFGL